VTARRGFPRGRDRGGGILGAVRTATLKPGFAKPLWKGHPWVYADSVATLEEGTDDLVRVVDATGKAIGRGWLSPASAIRIRLLDRDEEGPPEADLLASRLEAAVALRDRLVLRGGRTDACRLVHAEADGIPGLVVDRFGPVLVAQFATRPVHARRDDLARRLLALSGATSLLARPGGKEEEEGIPLADVPFAAGTLAPETVEVREDGVRFLVDLRRGQKTGHYADQRENRRLVGELAAGLDVLDLHAGTGGFSIHALVAGARAATAVDSSGPALACARGNAERNEVGGRLEVVEADALDRLDAWARAKTSFDVIVADPPRFATTRKGLDRALLAYRRLNAKALARVRPGGFFATFSCSGAVDPETFGEMVRAAARDAGRDARLLRVLSAGPDHPVALFAPEGRYLTGLLLQVLP